MNVTISAEEVGSIRDATRGLKRDAASDGIAADRLRSIVERIERLNNERHELTADIKDIYTEAKGAGFDVKILRKLIAVRQQDPTDVEEQMTLLDLYRRAIG